MMASLVGLGLRRLSLEPGAVHRLDDFHRSVRVGAIEIQALGIVDDVVPGYRPVAHADGPRGGDPFAVLAPVAILIFLTELAVGLSKLFDSESSADRPITK